MHSLQKFDYIQTQTFCSIPVLRGAHLLATFFGSMCPKGVDGLTGFMCRWFNWAGRYLLAAEYAYS